MNYEVKLFSKNEIVSKTFFDNYYQAEDYIENLFDDEIENFEITDNFDEVLRRGQLPNSNFPSREEILNEMFLDYYPE